MFDWANSAIATVIQTFVFAAYFTNQVAADAVSGSVLWGNMVGVSGAIVALGGPVLGAVADREGRRKPWIAGFTFICVAATLLLWFIRPAPAYALPALILVGVSTIGYEFASMFYNAMLPSLAGPAVIGRWSGWGWGLGYAGGLACLVVALFGFIKTESPFFGLSSEQAATIRATFVLAGSWYLFFSLPLLLFTPDSNRSGKRWREAALLGIAQLRDSFRQARAYTNLIRFLIARMFYADGLATIFAFGGVYAAGTFAMNTQEVLLFAIGLNITAGLGAALFAWIDDWLGSRRTVLISLSALIVTAVLILLVHSATLFWTCGLLLGIFVGPVQAASRSYLARIAPPELRSQLFGLYALSGKATAFAGPLLVGWLTYASGSQRLGMASVVVFLAAGAALMVRVQDGVGTETLRH